MTRVEALAKFFQSQPDRWFDGRELAPIAGAYAWRTRVADLRRAPFLMTIENRLRRCTRPDGRAYVVSEYCFRPRQGRATSSEPPLLVAV
jgi:hypothetical protein